MSHDREIINQFFSTLVFNKVNYNNGHYIYAAKIHESIFINGSKYIILFVPSPFGETNEFKDTSLIKNLPWINLQTRVLKNSYKLKDQTWNYPRKLRDPLLTMENRSLEKSVYNSSELNCEFIIDHNLNKKTSFQYNKNILFSGFINTFNSNITINDSINRDTSINDFELI